MNEVEELLNQAQAKIKKMCQESYHEGFADAEGALDIMQKRFNEVQGVLLKALGRKQRMMESTIDTANDVAVKLLSVTESLRAATVPTSTWGYGGGLPIPLLPEPWYKITYTEVPVHNKPLTVRTPTSGYTEMEEKLQKLAAYFEKRAKENKKRAEKHEKTAAACYEGIYTQTAQVEEKHGYYFSGKSETYAKAAQKVRELLG